MNRPQHNRSVSDHHRGSSSSSGTRQMAFGSALHLPQPGSSPSAGGLAGRRRGHLQHLSLPHNAAFHSDGTSPRSLSPFEERYLGRGSHATGILLAEPTNPSPSVTGKFLSSVKRAVSLKEKKNQSPADLPLHFERVSQRPSTPQGSRVNMNSGKQSRGAPPQSIITAHRSPFGGYTKDGDFVVTRTTDGRRLPVPQPHPHSHTNPRINLPPPPAHSALRKNSSVSIESGDSYTLVTTPDSASSVGSINAGGSTGKVKSVSMLTKLMGKGQGRSMSSTANSSIIDVNSMSTKKIVRFTTEPEDLS